MKYSRTPKTPRKNPLKNEVVCSGFEYFNGLLGDVPVPRESSSGESYFEYTFETGGQYWVGVSGNPNFSYDPLTGSGDARNGATGNYVLEITPITQGNSQVTGQNIAGTVIRMPNFEKPLDDHKSEIPVTLRRVNTSGNYSGNISFGTTTWVVIHGRTDSAESFRRLAGYMDNYRSNDQVLVLNWSIGAADNTIGGNLLDGAEWIPYIGEWASRTLQSIGLGTSQVFLVGHSWGTYVVYEIAARFNGGVQGIVAIDPAFVGNGYPSQHINFNNVSQMAWAFWGKRPLAGQFDRGSEALTKTANEAFFLEYDSVSNLLPDADQAHSAPIRLFESLVYRNHVLDVSTGARGYFHLGGLTTQLTRPWKDNGLNGFDASITVFEQFANGDWEDVELRNVKFRSKQNNSIQTTPA